MRRTNPYIHTYYVNLRNGADIRRERQPLASGDKNADRFVVYLQDCGTAVSLDGAGVTGKVIRPDGETVPLTGSVVDGAAQITLDEYCYAVPGEIKLTVSVSAGDMVQSVLIVTMDVQTSETSVIVDNGVIGTLSELLAEIENMRAATDEAAAATRQALTAARAGEYLTRYPAELWAIGGLQPDTGGTNGMTTRWRSVMLAARDLLVDAPDGVLIEVFYFTVSDTSAISFLGMSDALSGGVRLEEHWMEGANAFRVRCRYEDDRTVTADDLSLVTIRSDDTGTIETVYEIGAITFSNGVAGLNPTRARTGYIPAEPLYIVPEDGYKYNAVYYDADKAFVSSEAAAMLTEARLLTIPDNAAYIRLVAAHADDRTLNSTYELAQYCGGHIRLYTMEAAAYQLAVINGIGAQAASNTQAIASLSTTVQAAAKTAAEGLALAQTVEGQQEALAARAAQTDALIGSGYPAVAIDGLWKIGGLQPDTGGTNTMTTRWRTDRYLPAGDYMICAPEGVVYNVFSYAAASGSSVSYLGMSDSISGNALLSELLLEGANAYLLRGAYEDNRTVTEDDLARITIRPMVEHALYPMYAAGTIIASTGVEKATQTRVRTDYLPAEPLYVVPEDGYKFLLVYYDADKTYVSSEAADWLSEPRMLTIPDRAAYLRVVAAYSDDRNAYGSAINSAYCCGWGVRLYTAQSTAYLAAHAEISNAQDDPYDAYLPDVPENIGVLNTILNMKQMAEVRYTPLATIPQKTTDLVAGTTYKGMVYSSSRPEMGFVPNCVSLHTYMTAIKNPNSYLYTVDLGELGNVNGHTYYGSVCSTMICAALGIKEVYQTAQWADIPGMTPLAWQSPHALKLGDVVCTKAMGHVLMVTDITRNKRGKIGTITTMETGSYLPYAKTFTPDEFVAAYPTESWVYYRYERIHEAKHVPSPYVAVEDEAAQTVVYNTAIIPRKGDKANWLAGVPVEIDVLEAGSYTSVEIYRDDALYSTVDIAALITLTDLPYGSYKARLTDGTATSDWCYWMVVDAVSTAVATGNPGEIKVDFSASNAAPVYVTWCLAADSYPEHISTPTAEELAAGSALCAYKAGSYKVRVAFETAYGIVHTVLPEAITVEGTPAPDMSGEMAIKAVSLTDWASITPDSSTIYLIYDDEEAAT